LSPKIEAICSFVNSETVRDICTSAPFDASERSNAATSLRMEALSLALTDLNMLLVAIESHPF
jgi:hypothetical protein